MSINKKEKYQIAVIGGGPGGYVAAIKAAQLGADVVLIEKDKIGGTCLNWGCIPTKALVRSAEVYTHLLEADNFGISAENISVEMPKVIKRKDKIVNRLVKGVEHLLKANEIEVIKAKAMLIDEHKIMLKQGEQQAEITADNIIVATGSQNSELNIPGISLSGVIDSKAALDLEELPESLVVVGGGVIGMEFAFIYANLGVKVTVLEFLDQLVPGVDEEVAKELDRSARRRKIKIKTEARVSEIKETDSGLQVNYIYKEKEKSVASEKVLIAVGRKPYHAELGLEKIGIATEERRGGILVNEKLQTKHDHIYAIGDVTDKILLAHVASHQGIVAANNIMGNEMKMDYSAVPGAIFTSPEIGTVGLSEKEAKAKNIDYQVGYFPFAASGKVMAMGEREGKVKLISRKDNDQLIGAALIGIHASDLIAELTLAVQQKLKVEELVETIHAHPTTSEVIYEAALDLKGGAIHYNGR